ncbi:penicillin-binding protein activator [Aliiroseovarius sp.]|uniref:penicillin-binding protein activator n=1 Tax=Aliiroseovarius sp. TaxID=1872442 RepID=UPI00262250A9|nr:penicillin-binding protein activator [Aliiroseovarius sp.]
MFAVLAVARKVSGAWIALLSLLALAACGMTLPSGGPSVNTSRPIPVALLVPGGSDNAADATLATSLENAARLAMAELDGVVIDLRVYNTAADATTASAMATKAVSDGAKIILGPVYAGNANAAGLAVANRGINVLAFSNNTDIAGGNVFVLGHTFQSTANRLVGYAANQDKGNILIVHANSPAENAGRSSIERAIASTPATLAGIASFELSQTGIINALPEISAQVRDTGAQSIFLTSGTDGAIPFLAGLLPENGVKPTETQYIGLQRFDIPATAMSLPGLQGGWFALPDQDLNAQFLARYEARYGTQPHPIAGLAYDGIAAIGALASTGQSDALTTTALTQPQGFAGVNGVFRLRGDGTNERGLAVATIEEGQVVILEPAPRSFAGAGF